MGFTAVYDANVLYPNTLRDLLIRLGMIGMVRARWTEEIVAEVTKALKSRRPDIAEAKVTRMCEFMNAAIRDCLVTGYEPLVTGLELPDQADRHVLAAAICCRANAIVTFNLRDFPDEVLEPFGITAVSPDDFVLDMIDLDGKVVWACIQQIVDSRRNPPESIDHILGQLERSGLIDATAALRLS